MGGGRYSQCVQIEGPGDLQGLCCYSSVTSKHGLLDGDSQKKKKSIFGEM